eukprot:5991965-Pyramimonas_sp.AAC.1
MKGNARSSTINRGRPFTHCPGYPVLQRPVAICGTQAVFQVGDLRQVSERCGRRSLEYRGQ